MKMGDGHGKTLSGVLRLESGGVELRRTRAALGGSSPNPAAGSFPGQAVLTPQVGRVPPRAGGVSVPVQAADQEQSVRGPSG